MATVESASVATKKPRLIPVRVNRASNIQVSTGRSGDGKGHFDGARLLMLTAGENLVPEVWWADARKQKSVQRLLKCKVKRTGAPEDADSNIGEFILVEGKPLDADNPLLGLEDNEALEFIKNTEALALLKRLATQQASAAVMQSILAKIRKIEDPTMQPEKQ